MKKRKSSKPIGIISILLGLIIFCTIILPLLGFAFSLLFNRMNPSVPVGGSFISDPGDVDLSGSEDVVYEDRDYNCKDFKTHAEAQKFFEAVGPGDKHKLDRDGNGLACESLP